ncbi:MAG TPA: PstS family phosphate ABC transporter substrate-binding protein, partial [Thermoplasmatales archaeon]|nr:PstS family phosphate ABC transporter substrate-binding protein [Thermoplasmatales archaeon]
VTMLIVMSTYEKRIPSPCAKKGAAVAVSCLLVATLGAGCLGSSQPTLRVSGAWALYPMMVVWADDYQKTHDVRIEVSGGGAGKGMSDVLTGQMDIGMVSRPIRQEELDQGLFYLAVAKDAVVATISQNNPALAQITQQGLSREDLRKIFMKEVTRWGEVVGASLSNDGIVVLGRSDASGAAQVWAEYLGNYTQADLQSKADANYDGDMNMANGVARNKNAIGFNNINYAYNVETGGFAAGIRPVPLDTDGNGQLDPLESFYGSRNQFVENVSRGAYPSPPARNEYLVFRGAPTGEAHDFTHWILHDGQALIPENGYVELPPAVLEQERLYLQQGTRT